MIRIGSLLCALALLHLAADRSGAVERSFDSGGVKIRYAVAGRGEPVVLVHGFGASAEVNWRMAGVVDELARDYRVVTLDLRGHGKSDKPHKPKDYGLEMVRDVVRLLDHLKIDEAHLVGYSMGGFVVLKLIAEHPERVRTATLAASSGVREDFDFGWPDTFAKKLDEGDTFVQALLEMMPPGSPRPTKEQRRLLEQLLGPNDTRAMAAVLRSWRQFRVTYDTLEDNRVPTLVIYGEKEDPEGREYIEALEGRIGAATFKMIEGASHFDLFAHEELGEALREHFEGAGEEE